MRNIIINEAESIFEVLWNHGEPGTHKYCSIDEWDIGSGEFGKRIENAYGGVQFAVYPNKENKAFPFRLRRECDLDISEYDRLIIRGSVSKRVHFRCVCRIDGQEREVLLSAGTSKMKEYTAPIDGQKITHIRLEYENLSPDAEQVQLSWLGLAHSGRLKKMLARKSPYTPEWTGCFAEKADMTPQLGLYFGKEDVQQLRRKAASPNFKPTMDYLREQAKESMKIDPEADIGNGVHLLQTGIRERDKSKPRLFEHMDLLAFVGLIDQNEEMLRMACRMALAVCHCRTFADGTMTGFPGVSWHVRSFAEKYLCIALVKVLDWAGGLLSWHGRDVIQDAIIMKGIPRIDSDLKCLDDIWYTNQGLVYCGGLLTALIALSPRYPRYQVRIEEAEQNFMTMIGHYVQPDGGTTEGGSYWNFTLSTVTEVLLLLARYHKKTLADYVPEPIRKLAKYGEAVWSETKGGFAYIPYNDVFLYARYDPLVVYFMAKIGAGPFWESMCNRMNQQTRVLKDCSAVTAMLLHDTYADLGQVYPEDFISFKVSGVTALRREDPQYGRTAFYAIGGRAYPGHEHQDKGSFLLEAAGKRLLIDRGVPTYGQIEVDGVSSSQFHNLVTPVKDGEHLTQRVELFDITKDTHGDLYSGYVLESSYENNTFSYKIDLTDCWKDIFRKNVRSIRSADVEHYTIHDSLEIGADYEVCFILNTYGEITQDGEDFLITDGDVQLRIHTANWTADRAEFGPFKADGQFAPVNRLALYKGGQEGYELTTEVKLTKL